MDCIFDWFHVIQIKGGNFKIAPFFIAFLFRLNHGIVRKPLFPNLPCDRDAQ
jgi:hypothetical protein